MPVQSYLARVETVEGPKNVFGTQPVGLAVSKALAGRGYAGAIIRDGRGWCLFTVEAADFAPLDAMDGIFFLGGRPRDKMSSYLEALRGESFDDNPRGSAITAAAAEIGLTRNMAGESMYSVALDLMSYLDSAANPFMYERPTPFRHGTETDDFAGTGALSASWGAGLGLIWTRDDGALPTGVYASTWVLRSATYPDDQFAQVDGGFSTAGELSRAVPAVRCTGALTCYYLVPTSGNAELRRDATATYITDASTTMADGTPRTLKLDATGTTISAYNNTVSFISVSDSSNASGAPGVQGYLSAGASPPILAQAFECTDAVGGATRWGKQVAFQRNVRMVVEP